MGWISERHMRSGGSLNRNPSRQRKGPLRKIVGMLRDSTSIFDPAYVELECGHRTCSHGQFRARCEQCAHEALRAERVGSTEAVPPEGTNR